MLFPGKILGLFTTDQSVLATAGLYLLIVGIDLFPKSGNIIFGSGIRGYGEPSWMMKTQLFGTVFVIVASSVMVMVFHMGILEIFILVVIDESLRFLLNNRKLIRIRKNASQIIEITEDTK